MKTPRETLITDASADREAPLSEVEPIQFSPRASAGLQQTRLSADPAVVTTTFDRRELNEILALYGRKVAAGEWRDYAIDFDRDKAVFSVFRRASEIPLYRIEKQPRLARRQGAYSIVTATGLVLKRGHELRRLLGVLEETVQAGKLLTGQGGKPLPRPRAPEPRAASARVARDAAACSPLGRCGNESPRRAPQTVAITGADGALSLPGRTRAQTPIEGRSRRCLGACPFRWCGSVARAERASASRRCRASGRAVAHRMDGAAEGKAHLPM